MPTTTLKCGCTLDTDFVGEEHRPEGNPYHLALKPEAKSPVPEPDTVPAEAEDSKEEEQPKKKRW